MYKCSKTTPDATFHSHPLIGMHIDTRLVVPEPTLLGSCGPSWKLSCSLSSATCCLEWLQELILTLDITLSAFESLLLCLDFWTLVVRVVGAALGRRDLRGSDFELLGFEETAWLGN